MSPDQQPTTSATQSPNDTHPGRHDGPALIAVLLIVALAVGVLSVLHPTVRSLTMPRFGLIGLILCINPLIFLISWLRKPSTPALAWAAVICLGLGLINAAQILRTGTVSVVTNESTDRLHSSWYWSVLPMFLAGIYLNGHYWRYSSAPQKREASDLK